jgi:ABC-type amino acid transport substrate-binding protein
MKRLGVLGGLFVGLLLLGWFLRQEVIRLFPAQDQTWLAMQNRGSWRIGLDPSFPPFEYLDSAGNPIGFDVEMAQEIARRWGLQVEIVTVGFDSLSDALRAGRFDSVVSAFPYDARATRDIAFSTPYFEAGIRLVVRQGSPIQNIAHLAGRTVAVEWGSSGDSVGRQLQRETPTLQLAQFATPQEAVAALWPGTAVDALLIDNVTLHQVQAQSAPLIAIGPALESNPYVIVMPLKATILHEKVEQALRTLHDDGTFNRLTAQWFAP